MGQCSSSTRTHEALLADAHHNSTHVIKGGVKTGSSDFSSSNDDNRIKRLGGAPWYRHLVLWKQSKTDRKNTLDGTMMHQLQERSLRSWATTIRGGQFNTNAAAAMKTKTQLMVLPSAENIKHVYAVRVPTKQDDDEGDNQEWKDTISSSDNIVSNEEETGGDKHEVLGQHAPVAPSGKPSAMLEAKGNRKRGDRDHSAPIFPNGSFIYTQEAMEACRTAPSPDLVCVSSEHHVYVCDVGLSAEECQDIIRVSEKCSRGNYAAYTYAKQTLGCRDYDELAWVCRPPVLVACATIIDKLVVSLNGGVANRPKLVLDDREPHMVKYDISKKERQKLDMHTDKSEWTFLIALSEPGEEYDGGGTYFEALDATLHLQRGHCLIFPGKLRHCGQKITRGLRFLLVGFLVQGSSNTGNNSMHGTRKDDGGIINKSLLAN